jgi:prevent-host-death family protein
MGCISIVEAKARFSELVERPEGGEAVQITRRGKAVAQLVAVPRPRKPIDVAALRALPESMPMQSESAGDFVRRMRDEDRY